MKMPSEDLSDNIVRLHERQAIYATLDLCDGNKRRCAEMLGGSLKTLDSRLTEYQCGSIAASP
jgi:DNA-binding NtrC family response regulator